MIGIWKLIAAVVIYIVTTAAMIVIYAKLMYSKTDDQRMKWYKVIRVYLPVYGLINFISLKSI